MHNENNLNPNPNPNPNPEQNEQNFSQTGTSIPESEAAQQQDPFRENQEDAYRDAREAGYQAGYQEALRQAQNNQYSQNGYVGSNPSSYSSPDYNRYKAAEAQPSNLTYVALTLAIISLVMLLLPQSWFIRPIIAIVALVISINENKKQKTKLGQTTFILSVVSLTITAIFFIACVSCIGCGIASFGRLTDIERFIH
ncbi:MAG: hypothetical protein Q4P08_04795 [Eubacteriales bacterium]|nr:hypothetical protein [Eubacteriales bacterium]